MTALDELAAPERARLAAEAAERERLAAEEMAAAAAMRAAAEGAAAEAVGEGAMPSTEDSAGQAPASVSADQPEHPIAPAQSKQDDGSDAGA